MTPGLVELAGLPGSGKSTLVEALARTGRFERFERGNGAAQWLALPRTLSRFAGPLSLMLARPEEEPGGRAWLWRTVARLLAARRGRAGPDFARLKLLRAFHRYVSDVRAAQRLGRGAVLIDEGLIQAGIALWICTAPERRARFWREYLACVPGDTRCLVLRCDASRALERTRSRGDGLPWVFAEAEIVLGAAPDPDAAYAAIADLLADLPQATTIDADAAPDDVRDRAEQALASL